MIVTDRLLMFLFSDTTSTFAVELYSLYRVAMFVIGRPVSILSSIDLRSNTKKRQ
jgi:hypothetical protein